MFLCMLVCLVACFCVPMFVTDRTRVVCELEHRDQFVTSEDRVVQDSTLQIL
jgi:hypothetical protein